MNEDNKAYHVKNIAVPDTPDAPETAESWEKTNIVGTAVTRVDAYERLSGAAVYPSDVTLPGMLYGAILRCPHPNARILSIDTAKAEKLPGVRAVISGENPEAKDIVWKYSGEVHTKLFDRRCRFEGETVAAVAAESPYQAADAVHAIEVKYEVLNAVSDERDTMKQGAVSANKGSVVTEDEYSRGDVEIGFLEADVVLEHDFRTESELHTPMELHGCVSRWDGDSLVIWESTQGVYSVQSMVAETLGLPFSRVRVIGHYMGGGFGSKLQAGKYTVISALLAKKTARPVKLFLTREETFLAAGNRPPANMKLKAGVRKDGSLTAMEFTCTGTGGAYPADGVFLVDWLIRDLYTCPNVKTKCTDLFINAGPARPFRAPGHPQGSWALEQMIDSLAEAIGMDPVDLRLRNIPSHSQGRDGTPPYTTSGLRECIEKGAEAFNWYESRKNAEESRKKGHIVRGAGMAGASWFAGAGGPPSTILIKYFSDGSVNLNMGASDIGTGTKTIMAMVAAEELGINPESVQIENADTGTTQYATASGGSKTVPTEAPAVREAALDVKRQILEMAAEDLDTGVSRLEFRPDEIIHRDDPSKKIKITDISGLQKRRLVVGVGYRNKNPDAKAIVPFSAQFAEVEVNTKTGEVSILRFLGTSESGRVMDSKTFDSQVYGGITMGIGFGMTEERVLDRGQTGKLCCKSWHDYKLPTILDVPYDILSVPIDIPDSEANSTGAKGLGEPVTIPTAAAVANAIYNATGIQVRHAPVNPLKLGRLLAERRGET